MDLLEDKAVQYGKRYVRQEEPEPAATAREHPRWDVAAEKEGVAAVLI